MTKKGPKKPKRHVVTIGQNEPQSFPFEPDGHITRKSIRFYAARVTTDGAGNFLHRVSLRNPARAIDGAGVYADVVNLSNCWDVYKPIELRIELVPTFAITNFAVGAVILAPDYDDLDLSQVVATVADANQYSERKVLDPRYKTVTRFRIPTLQSGSVPGTVSTSPAVVQAGGFLDFQAPPFDGVVYLVGQGFPANLALYDIFLEMDLLLKFSR